MQPAGGSEGGSSTAKASIVIEGDTLQQLLRDMTDIGVEVSMYKRYGDTQAALSESRWKRTGRF